MNYRRPTSPVFWVPIPDRGQSRMDLVDWRYSVDKLPPQMELTDPDTRKNYTLEILDYSGPYPIDNLPDQYARQIINKDATGRLLARFLVERVPEFRNCQKVLFYQVNPIQ